MTITSTLKRWGTAYIEGMACLEPSGMIWMLDDGVDPGATTGTADATPAGARSDARTAAPVVAAPVPAPPVAATQPWPGVLSPAA